MIEHPDLLKRIIAFALEEDLGPGDLTTHATIHPGVRGEAFLISREELVLAGLPVFEQVFLEINPATGFEQYFSEGDLVPAGVKVCVLRGPLSAILMGERTALNFLQRMSGIATLTRKYVEKTGTTGARILDTRKTAPGIRFLDKYAVRIGGGYNHRFGLFDGILIKDNHIAGVGSITKAVELVRLTAPHTVRIEVEVEDLTGVKEAIGAGVDVILLDNMPVEEIAQAVKLVKGRAMLEASGGVNLGTVEAIARTGVDFISVGALTHSAKAADFSLKISAKIST
jgi:nicotinate-nucleotide pyrophosphorylase (carboxylating)